MDLRDVVGGPRDEAGRAESADFLGRHGLHFGEQLLAQLPAQFHGRYGAQVAGSDGGHDLHQGDRGHPGTQVHDRGDLPADDAVIDDGRVQGGEEEGGGGLYQLQENDGQHRSFVGGQQPAQQANKHRTSIARSGHGSSFANAAAPTLPGHCKHDHTVPGCHAAAVLVTGPGPGGHSRLRATAKIRRNGNTVPCGPAG